MKTTQNFLIQITALLFAVFVWSNTALGQNATFTTSGSWLCPAGVTCIRVDAWGAGGGGSGSNSSNSSGGGGGGAFSTAQVKVIPGNTYTITVGTGGTGGNSGGFNPGGNGGFSAFIDAGVEKVKAVGGLGSTGNTGAAGGLKANNIPANAGFNGGNGSNGRGSGTGGGSGGGGAGSAANGGNAAGGTGGTGGTALGGNGGNGPNSSTTGNNGANYGGAGSGVRANNKGGNGANGYLTITHGGICPTDPIEITNITTSPSPTCKDSTYILTVTAKNNTGANIANGSTAYAIDYSFDNVTWVNTVDYVDNIANGATNSYNITMPAYGTIGSRVIYVRVRTFPGGVLITSSTGSIVTDYCPKGADNCSSATLINTNGTYYGNTADFTADNAAWIEGAGFGTATIENNGWYKFVASATSVTYTVCSGACAPNIVRAIQFSLFSAATCGSGGISEKTFENQLNQNGCMTQTIGGLTIGSTYYMMVDGYEGADCPYTIQFTSGVSLPVKLTLFNGKTLTFGNELSWVTETEINNDYFELQASTDAINFITIDEQRGAGNSNTQIRYLSFDANPLANLTYYRLLQHDFDGNSSYSNIIALKRNKNNELFISPNPVNDELNVEFLVLEDGWYNFTFTDMTGKIISHQFSLSKGKNQVKIDVKSTLSQGFYILQINNEDSGESIGRMKFVKN